MSEPAIDRLEAYRQAGVDLDVSNAASQIATDWAQTTWGNRAGEFGEPVPFDSAFSSAKRLPLDEIRRRPGVSALFSVDGSGTKPDLYERMGDFRGLGSDLMAMVVDDIALEGGQPVIVNNALTVSTLTADHLKHVDQLFEGLATAANKAGVALVTGEIAVHGNRLQGPTDFTVDWIGDAMGLVLDERFMDGKKVEEGDELWAFAEPDGFRCNGISAVRKTLERSYGKHWHEAVYRGSTLGQRVFSPSTIYSGLMTALTGGYKKEVEPIVDIHGAAHITGGSLPEKVGRMLRVSGLGANIDDPFELPLIMRHLQAITRVNNPDHTTRPMTDEEMITTWHAGHGYVVAIHGEDGAALQQESEKHGITSKKSGRSLSKGVSEWLVVVFILLAKF